LSQPPHSPQQPRWIPSDSYPPPQGAPGGPPPPTGPPPRKKRHWIRNTFLAVAALFAVIIVIAVASSHGGVSTTPSGSTSAGQPSAAPAAPKAAPKAAGVGSYFDVKDASGDTYRVTLARVIDPAQGSDQFTTPDNGKRFVGALFTIAAISGSPQNEDANNDAVVIGSDGQSYTSDLNSIAGYTNFSNGQISVAQGATSTGAVTFQVPQGVKVAKVQWQPASGFGSAVQWNVP
jgi:hypothetical protein